MAKAPTTKEGTTPEVENEEAIVEERIAELERELESLDGPPPPLTVTDIAQGVMARVDKEVEKRKSLARHLKALKIKRLEMRRADLERRLKPHLANRETAGNKLAELEAQRVALIEEINKTRGEWGDAETRVRGVEGHIRQVDREIAALRSSSS